MPAPITPPVPLERSAVVARLAAIGGVVLAVAATFAWTAGWFSPARLDAAKIIDRFEQVNGVHPGFRRNHAKGVCIAGWFDSNGAAAKYSKAAVFQPGRVPVSGRFALAGGQPYANDTAHTVRSMALRFQPVGGEEWRTGMNDIPVFPVRTAQAFYEQLAASRPDPRTGKSDPAAMKAFLAAYPESARAIATIKAYPFSSGFGNAAYNSLNAFRFVDVQGRSTPVRWSMRPLAAFAPAAEPTNDDANFLFDAVIAEISRAPLHWHLVVTLAQAGDPTADATQAWPADREQVDAGMLTIDRVEGEDDGACRDINFDPLVLPSGIEPSDDPLLGARSAAYAQSFTRRAGEHKEPSAVRAPAVTSEGQP